jgi:TM2 domain-containing membrane protein YozV
MSYCSNCGAQIENDSRFCARCGAAQPVAAPAPAVVVRDRKEPWFALALSFLFSGLGQIYNGQFGKGIAFILAHAVSIALLWFIIGFITTPIIWIWGMVDAYKSAQRINFAHGIA